MIVMIFVVMIFLGIFCFKDKNQEILNLNTSPGVVWEGGVGEGKAWVAVGHGSCSLPFPLRPHPNLTNTIVATTDADAV